MLLTREGPATGCSGAGPSIELRNSGGVDEQVLELAGRSDVVTQRRPELLDAAAEHPVDDRQVDVLEVRATLRRLGVRICRRLGCGRHGALGEVDVLPLLEHAAAASDEDDR